MATGFVIGILLAQFIFVASEPLPCDKQKPFKPIPDNANKTIYYICFDTFGKPTKIDCPDKYEFNMNTKSCTLPMSVPKIDDPCTDDEQFDDPINNNNDKCDSYLKCTLDATTQKWSLKEQQCTASVEVFNALTLKCVPNDEWYCGKDGPDCSKYQDKRLLDKYDCSAYYQCYKDIRVKGKCPSGMIFDQKSSRCVDKGSKPCSQLSSDVTNSIDVICKGHAKEFVEDPNYCMGYYYCVDETTPYWSFCTGNKYFNNGKCTATRSETCKCEGINWTSQKVLQKHPDKTKFYVCEKGKAPVVKSCPGGTQFNDEVKSCIAG